VNELNFKKWVLVAVFTGLLVVFGIVVLLGREQVIGALLSANPKFLGISIIFQLLATVALTYRWQTIVQEGGFKISDWKLFQISLSSLAISNLTPSAETGGEFAKCYFLSKETRKRTKETLATIIAEKILDMIFFVMLTVFTLTLFLLMFEVPALIISLMILITLVALSMMMLLFYTVTSEKIGLRMSMWFINKFQRLIKRFRPLKEFEDKFRTDFVEHRNNMKHYLDKPKIWIMTIVLSAVVWTFIVLRTYFVFLAIGINLNPILIIALLLISQVVGMLPLLPGGLGLVETSRIAVISAAGVVAAGAGAHTVLDRLISFWIMTGIGLLVTYYLAIKNFKKDGSINKLSDEINKEGGRAK